MNEEFRGNFECRISRYAQLDVEEVFVAFTIKSRYNMLKHIFLNQIQFDNESIYSQVMIKLPTPCFLVFYNGMEPQPERRKLLLSAAFKYNEEMMLMKKTLSRHYYEEGLREGHEQGLSEGKSEGLSLVLKVMQMHREGAGTAEIADSLQVELNYVQELLGE